MFTPTLRCECAQPGLIDTMRKWSIGRGEQHFLNKVWMKLRERLRWWAFCVKARIHQWKYYWKGWATFPEQSMNEVEREIEMMSFLCESKDPSVWQTSVSKVSVVLELASSLWQGSGSAKLSKTLRLSLSTSESGGSRLGTQAMWFLKDSDQFHVPN